MRLTAWKLPFCVKYSFLYWGVRQRLTSSSMYLLVKLPAGAAEATEETRQLICGWQSRTDVAAANELNSWCTRGGLSRYQGGYGGARIHTASSASIARRKICTFILTRWQMVSKVASECRTDLKASSVPKTPPQQQQWPGFIHPHTRSSWTENHTAKIGNVLSYEPESVRWCLWVVSWPLERHLLSRGTTTVVP